MDDPGQEKKFRMDNRSLGHVAVIMDGNGRWANRFGKSRTFGHYRGGEVAKQIVWASAEEHISTLTLFAFSTENRQRPSTEIEELTKLFTDSLREAVDELLANGVRIRFFGDISFFENSLRESMREAESQTAGLEQLQLNVAVNYSGRWNLCDAVSKAVASGALDADMQAASIERLLPDYLGIGDVDLLIRTGGEHRLSNFLLWQSAYAELYFTDTLWPDFTRQEYKAALNWYAQRERRFGLTSAQVQGFASQGNR